MQGYGGYRLVPRAGIYVCRNPLDARCEPFSRLCDGVRMERFHRVTRWFTDQSASEIARGNQIQSALASIPGWAIK